MTEPVEQATGQGDWRTRLTALLDDYAKRPRPETSRDRAVAARAWQSEMVDAGVAAPGWPKTVGGLELGLEDQLDYYRMTSAAGVPKHPSPISFIVAPTLIVYGTELQKKRFLEPLLRADETWCQGFSEPGAGSDLASLSTKAVRDGDSYRVTGQKIWTTQATGADWMFALVRTGPAGRGTAGISYLLIQMDSPGIEVRPLKDASGGHHFAEVFFDDVVVPAENLVGEEGKGWSVMRTSLGHERATAFLADEFRYRGLVDKVFSLAIEHGYADNALIRQELAFVETGVRAIAANSARALDAVLRNSDPGGVASVNRLVKSEFEQQLHRLAQRLTGSGAALSNRSEGAVDAGRWTYGYFMSRASTIGAGTAEIQRNAIAEQVLGLPSHRGEGTRPAVVAPGRPLTPPEEAEAALREVLGKALASHAAAEQLLSWASKTADYDIGLWDELVRFGLPGLALPEDLGGGGAELRLLAAAVEEAGYAVAPVPLVPTLIALEVLRQAGAIDAVRAVCDGATAAFVVPVDDNGWVVDGPLPTLDGSRLSGSVERVPGAPVADRLVLLARDAATGELVLGTAKPIEVEIEPQESVDVTGTIAVVVLDGVEPEVIARGAEVTRILDAARPVAQLVLAADSVGVANRALALAVDWAGQREQFGHLIGSYQAISHRCADMLIRAEGSRSQVLSATDLEADDAEARLVSDIAAAAALDAAVWAAENCIQIHGGIGFTWEHPAHVLLRRATANQVALGRPENLRDRAAGAVLARLS
ncbi:acyl-CoA dehydrogenase family protein [Nocardia sp. NBC_00565]|uniref:acyl-CoA dehydrogenase family protein n=1 Tax=Nocardia sp. NBC_00565 TaxID=2975993 RepID=UPI002E7FBA7A|nr:acyl-CoA dehydrogenase family protein [Nocardia sp. NBC_00565]WUC04765.1 acyl-CoA dehydrogenase family protein [Nocardia sp. NBC_00565]